MKLLRYLLPLAAACAVFSSAFARDGVGVQDGSRFDVELDERDFEALRQYLKTKRDEPLDEKDNNLSISGDVRFEWRHMTEVLRGTSLRGAGCRDPFTDLPISKNDFDAEFNLKFDYILDRAWAVAHLQYDNSAGVDSEEYLCFQDKNGWYGSGKCNDICLRKAYMGYNICNDPCSRLDIELGRRGNLYHVFDSKVQFLSRFDGILLKWSGQMESISEWFVKAAGFVVDERVTHIGFVTELGALNIMDSGFDFKYSFIDWHKPGHGRCLDVRKTEKANLCRFRGIFNSDPEAFRFYVSQFTLYYNLDPELLCQPAKIYGAFVWNHGIKDAPIYKRRSDGRFKRDANGRRIKDGHIRANLAWYAGISIGEVVKEGDWALELQYQYVQALAVPDQDMSGIGTGNFFDLTVTRDGVGNTNFRGWKLEGLYALTDNLSIDSILEYSVPISQRLIGGNHNYSKVEVEAIYAF